MVIRAHAVHLVHEADARHFVLVRLPPDRLRLRLNARDGVEHDHAAIEDTQAALHLCGEVHMSGRVDDVDVVVAPLSGRRGGCYRYAALALLRHPVHRGRAVIHAANLADASCEIQYALRNRRLAGVDVGYEPDVSRLFQTLQSCRHLVSLLAIRPCGGIGITIYSGQRRGSPPPFCALLPCAALRGPGCAPLRAVGPLGFRASACCRARAPP